MVRSQRAKETAKEQERANKKATEAIPDPEPILIVPKMSPQPSPSKPNAPLPLVMQDNLNYNSSSNKADKEDPAPRQLPRL